MATKKRTGNKQPANDPALEAATEAAVDDAGTDAKNVTTSKEPPIVSINQGLDPDKIHLRDSRGE